MESATLSRVDWFTNRRLFQSNRDLPPPSKEAQPTHQWAASDISSSYASTSLSRTASTFRDVASLESAARRLVRSVERNGARFRVYLSDSVWIYG